MATAADIVKALSCERPGCLCMKAAKLGQGLTHCPAHADNTPSFNVTKKGTGGVLLKDHGGCSQDAVIAALRSSGLWGEADDAAGPAHRPGDSQGWPQTPQRVYEYVDPVTGATLAVKGRFERPADNGGKPDKTFRWRLPDGDYMAGIKERFSRGVVDMPLWGADAVLKSDPGCRVWVAEGESATEAIRARNEIAVCGAWGASQRDFGEAFQVLQGREVILWPDNDVIGREYMAEVRKALRGIARSIVTVAAPVPPKGDAVEYFQGGGTIERLLEGVVTRPTVDVVGRDHFIVRVPTEGGPVAFEFNRMMKTSGNLDCELTITHLSPVAEPEPYRQRINLLSQSARSSLETALGKQFGKDGLNWTVITSTAYARVQDAYLSMERAVQVASLPEIEINDFLVDQVVPADQPSIIFGDGSSGKTYICYAIALTVAVGDTRGFCGLRVAQGAVLIVDYETGGRNARLRFRRLLLGRGLDPVIFDELPIHFWDADGVPLADQVDALKRFVDAKDIRLVIVDSGADACGGEPEKAGVALAYFNALARLGTTTLTISHVTNTDAESSSYRPFGSRYWHNRARRTWYVKREQEEDSDDVDIALLCRKVNDGRKPRPIAFHLRFEGENGAVTISKADFRRLEAFETEAPAADRILAFLTRAGESTIADIAEETGLANRNVKHVLDRGRGSLFVQMKPGGKGRGNAATWGALASGDG